MASFIEGPLFRFAGRGHGNERERLRSSAVSRAPTFVSSPELAAGRIKLPNSTANGGPVRNAIGK